MIETPAPLRLMLSRDALAHNWQWLRGQSHGAACGAAIKADGYGLGAREVAKVLLNAGCRHFFVATWAEAADVADILPKGGLSVLHGIRRDDIISARATGARPVLNSAEQINIWRDSGGGQCDIMIDTGMNRLGLSVADVASGVCDGLAIHIAMSHLASADQDVDQNGVQLRRFNDVRHRVRADNYSLANSAGICLGQDYCFDLTRPGLALYGGIARAESLPHIRPVASPQAQVLQVRSVDVGDHVGYNATWSAAAHARIAVVNLGYADGYLRFFSGKGSAQFDGHSLPLVGRVSMDLTTFLVPDGCSIRAGDWVRIDYELADASAQTGLSQYELLTGLGQRYDRVWG